MGLTTNGAFSNAWAARQAINVEYVKHWRLGLDLEVLIGALVHPGKVHLPFRHVISSAGIGCAFDSVR